MRPNQLTRVLTSGGTAVCGWVSVDSGYLAEVLSHAGYDCVTVDLQHGMFGIDSAVRLLHAVGSGPATPLARTSANDPAIIGKLLDAGAYGIICPGVDSAAEAAAFVAACRYPPTGRRSFGPSRGLLYGGPDYVTAADETVLTWAMVESAGALDNLDAIMRTPGLDGVYVGPNDLALSLGEAPGAARPGPHTMDALARIAVAARDAGRWAGVFCASAALARELAELGYHLVTPGNDVGILRQAVAERVAVARGEQSVGGPVSRGGY